MNKIEEAILFALQCHEGQKRKLVNIPYILHPLEVCTIITNITADPDVIIAGLLHDTIEDCGVSPKEIKEKFGKRVAAIVQSESEDKYSTLDPKDTWVQRKEESLLVLKMTEEIGVKILWLADKLANLRSFYRSYLKQGDDIWLQLNQKDKTKHHWYYQTALNYIVELQHLPEYKEAQDLINKLFVGE
jgi:(p)ppGpp synthase/HD superfamily hydrolase